MPSINCVLFVNGDRVEIAPQSISHHMTAYEFLRERLRIKSLKFSSCRLQGGGNLGCVIMVTSLNAATGAIESHRAVDAACTPVVSLHGCAVSTVESLMLKRASSSMQPVGNSSEFSSGNAAASGGSVGGLAPTMMHPIQARLVACCAGPCGYCLPGVCMLLYTLLMGNLQPTMRDVERALGGVWCRCSGFRGMWDAARSFAVDFDEAYCNRVTQRDLFFAEGLPCDSLENYPPLSEAAASRVVATSLQRVTELRKRFPLYPHEHLAPPTISIEPPLFLFYGTKETAFLLPTSVDEVLRSCKVVPDYTTINGSDDYHHAVLSQVHTPAGPPLAILSTSRVKEMLEVNLVTPSGGSSASSSATTPAASASNEPLSLFIGAAATFASVLQKLPKLVSPEMQEKDPWTATAFGELRAAIEDFAVSPVEENASGLVSHLLARPCGDLVPLLHALGASLVVLTSRGRESFTVSDITGASRALTKWDVILGLMIPPQRNRFVGFAKATLSGPRSPATSAVAIACDVAKRDATNDVIGTNFSVSISGSSFYLLILPDVAAALERVNLTSDTIKSVRAALERLLMSLRNMVHGASDGRIPYRITVTRSLIFRLICKLQASVGVTPLDISALMGRGLGAAALMPPRSSGGGVGCTGVQSWEVTYGGLFTGNGDPYTDTVVVEIEPSVADATVASSLPPQSSPSPPLPAAKSGPPKADRLGTPMTAPPSKSPRPGAPAAGIKGEAAGGSVSPTPKTLQVQATNAPPPLTQRTVVKRSPVGDNVTMVTGVAHVRGETPFLLDHPHPTGTLFAAFVRSSVPKGAIKTVQLDATRAWPGFVGYLDSRDLPPEDHNNGTSSVAAASTNTAVPPVICPVSRPEYPDKIPKALIESLPPVFAGKEVSYVGQVIGVVIATSAIAARQAASKVTVEYVKDHRLSYCLSIAESRETKSFFQPTDSLEVLSVAASPAGSAGRGAAMPLRRLFDNKDLTILNGTFCIGGQFQLSSEPTTIFATLTGDGDLEVIATTEHLTKLQLLVSAITTLPTSRVVVKCYKLGGPAASPLSISLAAAVALAARKYRTSVVFESSIEEDAQMMGSSHSAMVDWRVAVDPVTTHLQGVDAQVFLNCGAIRGTSEDVLRQVLRHVSNAYRIPMLRARGVLCRTSFPPATAAAGHGPALGIVIVEHLMDAIARQVGVPRWKLQSDHLLQPNEPLPYGQVAHGTRLPTMWQDLLISSNVERRMLAVMDFNQNHRFVKRGIAMVPVLIGCRLNSDEDHRSTAIVTLFPDGTVRCQHGVPDCGIGVDTKVAQVVARCLNIPLGHVRVVGPDTGAMDGCFRSATVLAVDAACLSVLNACETLLQRLEAVRAGLPEGISLGTQVRAAVQSQISMSAIGVAISTQSIPASDGPASRSSPLHDDSPRLGLNYSPNASPTAASRNSSFLSTAARFSRPLTATEPFAYFVQGVSCTEAELDVLTGQSKLIRADMLLDGGQLVHPAMDAVVAESQFMKAYGWLMSEEIITGDAGHQDVPEGTYFNGNLGGYYLPRASDVPKDIRVAFLGGNATCNVLGGVHGSKSTVEASFALGLSSMFALREAAYAARENSVATVAAAGRQQQQPHGTSPSKGDGDASASQNKEHFAEMDLPLSCERLRMSLMDEFSQGAFAGGETRVVGCF